MKSAFYQEVIIIIKFESDKASLLPYYLYAQRTLAMSQYIEEDEQITTMKKLTCDDRVDEVCKTIERSANCFEDYIENLRRVNEMLLKGITLSQIINVLQGNKYESIDWRNNYMPYMNLELGRIEDVKFINQLPKFDKNEIKDVRYNDPATIVFWKDGTKTVVKCQKNKGDTYNPELGLAMCIIKKMCDNKGNYNDVFNKWLPKE